ncbi:AraC family transcriptional regulator [Dechloromonas denitrificans]|uniref:AraC family transcriptional regulator n=1 Tax=Dechloromonas denitrificans TaxID=281362 RepID=UPI001CF8BFE3|nr:AraC family transcriptional regulator [Dechloromonas denitrificans]UCV01682.1 AraC family transcriptional regulator [Dechloromonas denitrificans]
MSFHFLDKKSLVYSSADPYEVSNYVNQHVGSHNLRLMRKGQDGAVLNHRKLGRVDLCRITYGSEAHVKSDGLSDFYHMQIILKGLCRYEIAGHTTDFSAGQLFLINPDDPIDLTYSEDCEKFILKIPNMLFDEACQEHHWCKPATGIKFSPLPYYFHEIESLLYLTTLICQEAESGEGTPQVHGHYNRIVATKLLTMLKHNVALATPSHQCVSFERLEQYVEDNIKRDISVEELARYAQLSLRSLYLLFEKYASTTPKNFIRQKKLERVYAALMDPASKIANITAVAMEYGFTHLGRFSECYKSTFGLLPSDSLRQRQARH